MTAHFEDGKDETALRTIGEVAKALGIKTHVLRYWEQQFPTLNPLKRAGGRRYYRPDDVALIERIDALVNEKGYTLKGAKAALRAERKPIGTAGDDGSDASGKAPISSSSAKTAGKVDPEILPKLKSIRASLASALKV
jgi:DNA-binding transcriptional MerR regulator